MTIRTPTPSATRQSMLDLQRSKERLAILTQQLSSGNRITRPGDDPTGSSLILDFDTSIERNKAYIQQANNATSFLKPAEDALSSLNHQITRLLELGQQGLSDLTGASGRLNLSHEVDALRTTVVSIANTQAHGKYLFAGTRTLTQPFSGPTAGPIAYGGDGNSIMLDTSISAPVATNIPGDALFFGSGGPTSATDLFQQITDLRDGLAANNTAQIRSAYTNLQSIMGRINTSIADLGGRQAAVEKLQTSLGDYNLSLEDIKATYAKVDYPAAATQFTEEQITQQASMSVIAKMNAKSLFDYLG